MSAGGAAGGSATGGGASTFPDGGVYVDRGPISLGASIASLGLRGNNNVIFRFECPPLGNARQADVWGTTLYTDDSPICWAAAHSGFVTRAAGGEVFVEVLPGALTYFGTFRSGFVSSDFDMWLGSYQIIGAPLGLPPDYDGGILWVGTPTVPVGIIDWEENPQVNRGFWGVRFAYACPPTSAALGTIWGSGPYTDDSRICVAAMHAGTLTRDGGVVTVELVPGVSAYPSSTRNGVTSNGFGSYTGSFLVVP